MLLWHQRCSQQLALRASPVSALSLVNRFKTPTESALDLSPA